MMGGRSIFRDCNMHRLDWKCNLFQASHSDFTCVIEIEGTSLRVPAHVEGSRFVVCEETRVSHLK